MKSIHHHSYQLQLIFIAMLIKAFMQIIQTFILIRLQI